jgi:hypothetical protein
VLSNGVLVADDWADLTSGALRHRIDQAEAPQLPPANGTDSCNPTVFWSATDERGRQYGGDCDGWTATGDDLQGVLGVEGVSGTWSTFCHGNCASLAPLRSFVLPGGSALAAHLHLSRTVSRRAERLCVELAAAEEVNPAAVKYLNRLSDWFFVASRAANGNGKGDVLWVPGANR